MLALLLRGCHQDKSLVVALRGALSSQNPSENPSKITHANGGKNCLPVKTPAAQRQRGWQAVHWQRNGGRHGRGSRRHRRAATARRRGGDEDKRWRRWQHGGGVDSGSLGVTVWRRRWQPTCRRRRQLGGSARSLAAAAHWEAQRQCGVGGGSMALVEVAAAAAAWQAARWRRGRGGMATHNTAPTRCRCCLCHPGPDFNAVFATHHATPTLSLPRTTQC